MLGLRRWILPVCRQSQAGQHAAVAMLRATRLGLKSTHTTSLIISRRAFATEQKESSNSDGSLFGEVSEFKEEKGSMLEQMSQRVENVEETSSAVQTKKNKDFLDDPEVREISHPKAQTAVEKLLSPIKREVFEKMIADHGKYIKNQMVTLADGRKFKLQLSKEELEVLEPSVYLQSYRIKSSVKKTYPFLRMLRQMDLKDAITQCHFSAKKVSRETGAMLERGVNQAADLGLNADDLYIEQIWVGKDGFEPKRIDFKGRGRMGIINHKYVHVKAILRRKSFKEAREASKVSKVDNKKVWQQLASRKIKDHPLVPEYKW